ncbi:MAG: hypothetical protein JWM76_3786 [Pseudonocardiales bacterium]|nr:hypothetical protein [Pseudonocardiales bacterium]
MSEAEKAELAKKLTSALELDRSEERQALEEQLRRDQATNDRIVAALEDSRDRADA